MRTKESQQTETRAQFETHPDFMAYRDTMRPIRAVPAPPKTGDTLIELWCPTEHMPHVYAYLPAGYRGTAVRPLKMNERYSVVQIIAPNWPFHGRQAELLVQDLPHGRVMLIQPKV
jgi:hypothetical protein